VLPVCCVVLGRLGICPGRLLATTCHVVDGYQVCDGSVLSSAGWANWLNGRLFECWIG